MTQHGINNYANLLARITEFVQLLECNGKERRITCQKGTNVRSDSKCWNNVWAIDISFLLIHQQTRPTLRKEPHSFTSHFNSNQFVFTAISIKTRGLRFNDYVAAQLFCRRSLYLYVGFFLGTSRPSLIRQCWSVLFIGRSRIVRVISSWWYGAQGLSAPEMNSRH